MSKTSRLQMMILAMSLGLPHAAKAITNAELARLNNELIGLDAQLAVAKKKSELEKYRSTGSTLQPASASGARPAPARPDETANAIAIPSRRVKGDTASDFQVSPPSDGAKTVNKKSRPQ